MPVEEQLELEQILYSSTYWKKGKDTLRSMVGTNDEAVAQYNAQLHPAKTSLTLTEGQEENNQAAPGPGQYKVRGAFIQKYVPENLQFFGSTQRRFDFKQKKSSMPGPGSLFCSLHFFFFTFLLLYIYSFVYHLL